MSEHDKAGSARVSRREQAPRVSWTGIHIGFHGLWSNDIESAIANDVIGAGTIFPIVSISQGILSEQAFEAAHESSSR